MPGPSSLSNRIFFACTALATLSLGFAFYFVSARVTSEAEADLRRGLDDAATLVDERRIALTDTFTRMARLVADLPKLKAAVDTGDPPTVQGQVDDYRRVVNADLLIVSDPRGRTLGSSADRSALPLPLDRLAPPGSTEVSTVVTHPRGVLQLVGVPIVLNQPAEILGGLTVGFFFDDHLALDFKRLTGSDIAFAAGGRVLAASLPADRRDTLPAALGATGVVPVRIGGEEYLALARSMAAPGTPAAAAAPVVLVLRSRTERLRFLNTLRTGLAGGLVLTIVLATILSFAVARTMTRPLAAVTRAMREVAATGDLTRRVTLRSRAWDDEDARLLAASFNTLTESIARFQREAAQKERLSSLGRLSTVVAHEIRNPLMIIRATLSTLQRDALTAAEIREAVADIDEETRRLNRVVSEVLDFAKPIRFELAEMLLNDVCRDSAAAVTAGEGADVLLDLDAGIPPIVSDAERLRTALVNLLTNARHAVQAAHAAAPAAPARAADAANVAVAGGADVIVRTRRVRDTVTVTIEDRGVGISEEDMAHIFDPYFTTRRAGTGLGLPIAKTIIERLGGSIQVTSRPGHGTVIGIVLPLTAPETEA